MQGGLVRKIPKSNVIPVKYSDTMVRCGQVGGYPSLLPSKRFTTKV